MNPPPLADQPEASQVASGQGVGRRLRAARVDLGVDLERIAAQLHLSSSLVEALEAERYDALPGPLFVAGYIRNYARLVGLDPTPLIAAYHSTEGHAEPTRVWTQTGAQTGARPRTSARTTRRDRDGSGLIIRLVTVLVIAGLAYLFVQWWQNRAPTVAELAETLSGGPDAAQPEAASDPSAPAPESAQAAGTGSLRLAAESNAGRDEAGSPQAVPAVVVAHGSADTPPPPGPALPIAEVAPEPTSAAETPDVSDAPEGPAAVSLPQAGPDQTPPDQGGVVLEFRGPCWIDVRDSAKSFSLTGEMNNGDRRVLGGTPPYSLILGNANSARVTVNGVPFDLARVSKGNVARFKLDPAELP